LKKRFPGQYLDLTVIKEVRYFGYYISRNFMFYRPFISVREVKYTGLRRTEHEDGGDKECIQNFGGELVGR
jgi:hypothetical protein